eukprot:jgi/Bigna1/140713/aug1.58_g15421
MDNSPQNLGISENIRCRNVKWRLCGKVRGTMATHGIYVEADLVRIFTEASTPFLEAKSDINLRTFCCNIVIRSWDWLNRQFVSENHHGIDGHNALLSLSTARGHRRAAYTGATMPCDQWERDDNGDDDSDDDEDTSHQQTFISSHTSSFGEWVEAGMIVIKMSIRSVSEDSPEDAFAACLKEVDGIWYLFKK